MPSHIAQKKLFSITCSLASVVKSKIIEMWPATCEWKIRLARENTYVCFLFSSLDSSSFIFAYFGFSTTAFLPGRSLFGIILFTNKIFCSKFLAINFVMLTRLPYSNCVDADFNYYNPWFEPLWPTVCQNTCLHLQMALVRQYVQYLDCTREFILNRPIIRSGLMWYISIRRILPPNKCSLNTITKHLSQQIKPFDASLVYLLRNWMQRIHLFTNKAPHIE